MSTPLEWHASAGGQVDADSHGIVNVGIRRGPWSVDLLTDTLQVRWDDAGDVGRGWLAVRAEGGAAGLLISPWTDGAPDPGRALLASYVGVEGGAQRYLPHGLYVGADYAFREWFFSPEADTTIATPDPRPVVSADLHAGYWSKPLRVWARGGVDWSPGVPGRHLAVEGVWWPETNVAPRLELRAGAGAHEDFVTKTRLGGVTPYVVPLAGAAWAEWRVEDYAAARIGGSGTVKAGAWTTRVGPLADLATFDGQSAVGFGLDGEVRYKRFFTDVTVGVAPWIPRQEGIGRASVYFELGLRAP